LERPNAHGPLGGDVSDHRCDRDRQLLGRLASFEDTGCDRQPQGCRPRIAPEGPAVSTDVAAGDTADAGRSYIEACKRIIEQVDDAEREVSGEYRIPKGDLAVTTPWGIGHTHLVPLAVEFLKAYPDIYLRLLLTDRVVNVVDESIDFAVRVGVLPDSGMIATRIGSIRIVVCASPSYLKKHGRPKQLSDLAKHNCITIDDHATPSTWKFVRGSRATVAPIASRLCVNTSEAAVLAAIEGAGLTRVMSYKMDAAKRAGKLAIVLEEFEPEPLPVHIIYAPRKPVPLKLRAFINWITPRLKVRLASD
jgi:DNA-binding transcriptional LysR family regulator